VRLEGGRQGVTDNPFFDRPILNSPYERPARHWELDSRDQPTQQVTASRRSASYITPIPKPKKRKAAAQEALGFGDESDAVSTDRQKYDPTPLINTLRGHVDGWRSLPNPRDWHVTPETAPRMPAITLRVEIT
jgi:type III restriction enzyme